jgi:transcription initiation factor TFIIH subunit 1
MAIPTGAAAYKKKDGILTVTTDRKTVIWTPNSAAAGLPTLSLSVSNITSELLGCTFCGKTTT